MRFTILLLIVIVIFVLLSGCTIHFKGENIELDADRQRVYRFDSVTFTDFAKTDLNGSRKLYSISYIDFYDHKL